MKTINEKLVYFAETKGLSQYKFCKETGLSDGALRGSRSIGVESLAKIKEKYPDLNLDWIMFDKGPMTKIGGVLNEPSSDYAKQISIDGIVDAKIEEKLAALRKVISEYIREDILKEIDDTISEMKREIKK